MPYTIHSLPNYAQAELLATADLTRLVQSSNHSRALFQPILKDRKLLHHVTRCDYESVTAMLNTDIHLLHKKIIGTDCSGRTFERISPFQYALWALDKHMWTIMLDMVLQNEKKTELLDTLLAQYRQVQQIGVTYRHNGQPITESHFDFENTIINELQKQVDYRIPVGNKNWKEIDKHFVEGVGAAQRKLPVHVVIQMCSPDVSFLHVPKFISRPQPSVQFYNYQHEEKAEEEIFSDETKANENWYSCNSQLGVTFAISKGTSPEPPVAITGSRSDASSYDLAALKALNEIRTKEFANLETLLEQPLIAAKPQETQANTPRL